MIYIYLESILWMGQRNPAAPKGWLQPQWDVDTINW